MQAALAALLRWGWRPSDFVRLTAGELAFVVAGLEWEQEKRAQSKMQPPHGKQGRRLRGYK